MVKLFVHSFCSEWPKGVQVSSVNFKHAGQYRPTLACMLFGAASITLQSF